MFRIIIILTIMLFLFGCNSTKDKIVGKWKENNETLEFLKDGTLVLADGKNSLSGKWSILDDGRLKIDISSPLGGNVIKLMKITIKDSTMTTTDENNSTDTLTKIK